MRRLTLNRKWKVRMAQRFAEMDNESLLEEALSLDWEWLRKGSGKFEWEANRMLEELYERLIKVGFLKEEDLDDT